MEGKKIPNFTLDLRDTPFAAIYTTESVDRGWGTNIFADFLKTGFTSQGNNATGFILWTFVALCHLCQNDN